MLPKKAGINLKQAPSPGAYAPVARSATSPACRAPEAFVLIVDLPKWDCALAQGHLGRGPLLYASPSAHCCVIISEPEGSTPLLMASLTLLTTEAVLLAALAFSDDKCGAITAQHSAAQQATANLTGMNTGLATLSSRFTGTNLCVEDTLLRGHNVMSFGALIWSGHLSVLLICPSSCMKFSFVQLKPCLVCS